MAGADQFERNCICTAHDLTHDLGRNVPMPPEGPETFLYTKIMRAIFIFLVLSVQNLRLWQVYRHASRQQLGALVVSMASTPARGVHHD